MCFNEFVLTQASPEFEKPAPVPMCTTSGYESFLQFRGECYQFVEEAKTFDDAEAECVKKGAHLASIGDIGSEFFTSVAVTTSDAWIGLSNKKVIISVTRLGDLLHFGRLFKTSGNNYFAPIAYIFRQFL